MYTSFCCLMSVMIPTFHSNKSLFGPAFSLPAVAVLFLEDLAPFFETWLAGTSDVGLTSGVCSGSAQAKEQRFLRILALGLGERSLQISSRWLIH